VIKKNYKLINIKNMKITGIIKEIFKANRVLVFIIIIFTIVALYFVNIMRKAIVSDYNLEGTTVIINDVMALVSAVIIIVFAWLLVKEEIH